MHFCGSPFSYNIEGMTVSKSPKTIALTGGCHCGAVRYEVTRVPRRHSLCHCKDCQRTSGAPVVAWAVFDEQALTISGATSAYNSSGDVVREFCPKCGTGLFYRSASFFPGEVDVRTATLDNFDDLPATELIQLADTPVWWKSLHDLPSHERYP